MAASLFEVFGQANTYTVRVTSMPTILPVFPCGCSLFLGGKTLVANTYLVINKFFLFHNLFTHIHLSKSQLNLLPIFNGVLLDNGVLPNRFIGLMR